MSDVFFTPEEEASFKNTSMDSYPDGQYLGRLADAGFVITGKERRKKLCLVYEIVTPDEFAGCTYKHFLTLDMPTIMFLVKKTMILFGIDRNLMLKDLDQAFKAKLGKQVVFTLATKDGKYQNANLSHVMDSTDKVPDFDSNQDIPF